MIFSALRSRWTILCRCISCILLSIPWVQWWDVWRSVWLPSLVFFFFNLFQPGASCHCNIRVSLSWGLRYDRRRSISWDLGYCIKTLDGVMISLVVALLIWLWRWRGCWSSEDPLALWLLIFWWFYRLLGTLIH